MQVDADVVLDPACQEIRARFRVTGHPGGPWRLHDQLDVVRASVDGLPTEVRRLRDEPPSPFSQQVHLVELGADGDILEVEIEGRITQLEAGVNCICDDLTELALYAGWFPVFPSLPRFGFTLDLTVLGSGPVEVNGVLLAAAGRRSWWRSTAPGIDITVVASPVLREVGTPGLPVRLLAAEADAASARHLLNLSGDAVARCTTWWGSPRGRLATITIVRSPRAGWAYSRLPLILLPGGASEDTGALHMALHEIGHLWWSVADVATADDWLNEGLAEYTADRLWRELLPERARATRIASDLTELAAHPDDAAIMDTCMTSPGGVRHRNRYLRASLAIGELERTVGTGQLDLALSEWLSVAGDSTLQTPIALDIVQRNLGQDASAQLHTALTTPGWQPLTSDHTEG